MINENYEFAKDYLNQRRIINDKNQEKNRNNFELSTMDSKANDVKKLIQKNRFNGYILEIEESKLEILDEKKNSKNYFN